MRRFSANASKARQATSRKRQLEKIKIEEMRPSSRQNPYIRFEQAKKLYRSAVTVEGLSFRYPGTDRDIFTNLNFTIEAEQRVAIIGPNGIGKTTLMRCLAGELTPTAGRITWVENAQPGYMPQDPQAEFDAKVDLFTWMSTWTGKADDEQIVRATLGRLLFSGDETKKSVKVLSGGEKGRMMYGKLMLTRPNVLLMDEPTNHMDMETIESLQIGLEKYPGHADLRLARPRVRRRPRDAHDRAETGRQLRRLHGQLRRIPRQPARRRTEDDRPMTAASPSDRPPATATFADLGLSAACSRRSRRSATRRRRRSRPRRSRCCSPAATCSARRRPAPARPRRSRCRC